MDQRDLGCLVFAIGLSLLIAVALAFLAFTAVIDFANHLR